MELVLMTCACGKDRRTHLFSNSLSSSPLEKVVLFFSPRCKSLSLMNHPEIRWIKHFENYRKALVRLTAAVKIST
jgi:hypothetical protein